MSAERRVAVITGASQGIGAGLVRGFLDRGYRVVANSRSIKPDAHGGDVLAVAGDITDPAVADRVVGGAVAKFGRVDVLVNNAGLGGTRALVEMTDDEWHRVLDVNLLGIVRATRAALPALRRSPSAAIVNTGSIAATAGIPQRAAYSASKGAVHALTRAMAADHLGEGIRVCAVAPGTADTPWVGRLLERADDPAAERAALEARQPHGRLVSADEVAGAVAYLAGPRSTSTTGIVLAVDGGMQELRLRPKS